MELSVSINELLENYAYSQKLEIDEIVEIKNGEVLFKAHEVE